MGTQRISIEPERLLELTQVGGNVQIEGWDQPDVQADGAQVHIERRSDAVAISCGGDLVLSVPRKARLSLSSIGGDVHVHDLGGTLDLGLIGGDAILKNLTGPVRLSGMIGGNVRMENVADVSMSSSGEGPASNIERHIRGKVEHATRRVEAKVRRAEHRAYQHAQRVHHADSARWKYDFGQDPGASPEGGEAVSDEERMTVLRMLQEKKITAEQAEQLLAALEGHAG